MEVNYFGENLRTAELHEAVSHDGNFSPKDFNGFKYSTNEHADHLNVVCLYLSCCMITVALVRKILH